MTHRSSPPFRRHSPLARAALSAALLSLSAGCTRESAPSGNPQVPNGAFAVVGDRVLGLDLLQRSASVGGVRAASQRLVSDALVALESAARQPDRAAVVERGVLVRGLVESLRQQTLATSPPRSDELEEQARALWMQLDRPRCVRTVNVMAAVPPFGDGAREERVLRRLADEVRGSGTPEELARRVERADKEGVNVELLLVPPLTADGRIYVETPVDAGRVAPPIEYARAAAGLTHIGETSDLVSTSTGFHVLMATDILPPVILDEAERNRRLRSAVADRRIQADLEGLRQELTTRANVWQSPHRSSLTSLVWRTQPGQ